MEKDTLEELTKKLNSLLEDLNDKTYRKKDNFRDELLKRVHGKRIIAYVDGKRVDEIVFSTVKEACEYFNISQQTVRRRLERETLNPYLNVDFKYDTIEE